MFKRLQLEYTNKNCSEVMHPSVIPYNGWKGVRLAVLWKRRSPFYGFTKGTRFENDYFILFYRVMRYMCTRYHRSGCKIQILYTGRFAKTISIFLKFAALTSFLMEEVFSSLHLLSASFTKYPVRYLSDLSSNVAHIIKNNDNQTLREKQISKYIYRRSSHHDQKLSKGFLLSFIGF